MKKKLSLNLKFNKLFKNLTNQSITIIIFLLFIFVLGIYFYTNSYKLMYTSNNFKILESMENKEKQNSNKQNSNKNNPRCPNMLIEKDSKYFLYNSKLAIVPGVNPIQFDTLEEYSEFVEWQTSQKINCPVLFLQYTTDTQNNDLLQVKPTIFENQGGLPNEKSNTLIKESDQDYVEKNKILDATKNSTPNSNLKSQSNPKKDIKFNNNMYSGFDKHNQNIGLDTPLDRLFHERGENGVSRNPMDTNWGGKQFTKNAINKGDYKGREIYK